MAATVATQKICALGPIKMEVLNLTGTTNADTFTTLIQNPQFAMASEQGANTASTVAIVLTGSGSKVGTIRQQTASGGAGNLTVLVFGF
jgi:hypothetical protein